MHSLSTISLVVLVGFCASTVCAQPDSTPKAADTTQKQTEKEKIMSSPEWERARQAFEDWLDVQTMYNEQEVAQLRADLRKEIASMTAPELKQFLGEIQAKLNVLLGNDVEEARQWVGKYLSVLATHQHDDFLKKLPDVRDMSADEMQKYLQDLQQQRRREISRQRASDRAREQQVARAKAQNEQRMAAYEQTRQRQQSAVARQATDRFNQANKQSMTNARSWKPPEFYTRPRRFYPYRGYRW